jgi:hypothetical protein
LKGAIGEGCKKLGYVAANRSVAQNRMNGPVPPSLHEPGATDVGALKPGAGFPGPGSLSIQVGHPDESKRARRDRVADRARRNRGTHGRLRNTHRDGRKILWYARGQMPHDARTLLAALAALTLSCSGLFANDLSSLAGASQGQIVRAAKADAKEYWARAQAIGATK